MSRRPRDVSEYIAGFPESTQKGLKQLRRIIRRRAPLATECISYGMAAYFFQGRPLV